MEEVYVPGLAAVHVTRSVLDSKIIWTFPVAFVGITTALDGVDDTAVELVIR